MRTAAIMLAAAALAACAGSGPDGGGGGNGGGGGPCRKNPPTPTVSFSQNVQPIFTRSCAVAAACHAGPTAVYGNLSAGAAYGTIVRQPSIEQPRLDLVAPGNADDSYLVRKIEGGPDITGQLMPLGCPGAPQNGAACLSADEIGAIRTWVDECAQQN